ncbi:DUF1775 domain-containing protein [Streptomyces sp. P17]|uniref:DUF1775 domain-containing protein n=1 Tax=Streptomyces sp. P17 TaxID=3074716 RepID=UPI0028F4607C|nr:DUF1775 domain-containing protein [Streptomyces sp. P17]MDT9698373.1 DUF1775 domain-containing protein [Streptomyces sp. P17]
MRRLGRRGSRARSIRTGACVRAAAFALIGSVLAALGHHAVAEGSVPWRLVAAFTVGQFVAMWPFAQRRLSLPVVVACTLAAQGALHLTLTVASGTRDSGAGQTGHHMGGGAAMPVGDGHAWHHASTAMTFAHLVAALAAGRLLQRADAALSAALTATRAAGRAATDVLARLVPRLDVVVVPAPTAVRLAACFAPPAVARTLTLEHALVRRGPPGHAPVPVQPLTRAAASACPDSRARSSMSTHHAARLARRAALVGAAALTATLALAAPAVAHAEVEADKPQALAENVTLSFVSEAESSTAGFTELRIVLPKGIAPADVALEEAPKGWKLKATDDGYTVGGPELAPGADAAHSIKVRQLPDAKEIAFKTVEVYEDGKVSRWIEVPSGGAEAEQPAPVLELKAAAPGATPVSPSPTASPTPSPTPTPTETTSPTATADADDSATDEDKDEDSSTGIVVGVVVVALLAVAGGAWWLVRRRSASAGS